MGKFIKRHRYTCILVLVYILIVILGLKVKELLIPDEGKATYGERLKDMAKHPISDEVYDKISSEYDSDDRVIKVNHRLSGKILNFYITFKDDVSPNDAKGLGEKLLTYFDDDTKGYYSFQIYLVKEDESKNNFPIIGMKDPLSNGVSWTKDREITVSESNEE